MRLTVLKVAKSQWSYGAVREQNYYRQHEVGCRVSFSSPLTSPSSGEVECLFIARGMERILKFLVINLYLNQTLSELMDENSG